MVVIVGDRVGDLLEVFLSVVAVIVVEMTPVAAELRAEILDAIIEGSHKLRRVNSDF